MPPKLNVKIESLNYADIDACADISPDSFSIDPHTIVKQLGRDGYDMHDMARRTLIPWIGPADAKPQEQGTEAKAGDKVTQQLDFKREPDAIERLHTLEDEDMQYFQYKSRGVGSALLGHGNAIADRLGLPIWVHSSHQAVNAHGKGGFEPVRVLHLDLDETSTRPRPPRDDEPVMGKKGSGKWGHYVIQYMKREPREFNEETMQHLFLL
ncbi:hypothetical protein MY11210_007904 [Beauveria gryllotalpidicola]